MEQGERRCPLVTTNARVECRSEARSSSPRKSQPEGGAWEILGSGGGTPAIPAIDVKLLYANIGEQTLENDSFQGALTKAGC
jgi:hypothetical protein